METVTNIYLDPIRLQCRLCSVTFQSQVDRFNHTQSNHDIRPSFPCPFCESATPSRGQFDLHLSTHFDPFEPHVGINHGLLRCRVCKEVFQNEASITQHVMASHAIIQGQFHCPACPEIFTCSQTGELHIKNGHKWCSNCFNSLMETGGCFICDQWVNCKDCPAQKALKCRNGKCARPALVDCRFCSRVFTRLGGLLDHHRMVHSTVPVKLVHNTFRGLIGQMSDMSTSG